MRLIKNKKGLSPVIATVLLISLSVVLVGIVFMWMRGFVSEQVEKQGKPIEQICGEVRFDKEFQIISNAMSLQIINRGNVPIYGMDVKFVSERDSSMKSFRFSVNIGEASEVQMIPLLDNPKEVVLYPMVLGSVKGKKLTKPMSCLSYGQTISVD
jgi:hypothetical protein